jgi:DNA primase
MNFEDLLAMKGVDSKPGSKEGEINICCPFCIDQGETEDERYRLGINVKHGKANCFNCGWRSSKDTLKKILDKLDVKDELDESLEEEQSKTKPISESKSKLKLPDSYERLWPCTKKDKDFRKALSYILKRGISEKQIRTHKIGFALAGDYAYRVIFPVYYGKKLKSIVSRDYIGTQYLRYKNSKGNKALYNAKLPNRRSNCALLVEGIPDCLAAERMVSIRGIDCMALLGKSLKDEQLKYLKGYKKYILAPDNDGPGLRGMLRVAKKLSDEFGEAEIYFAPLRGYKDLSAALQAGKKKLIRRTIRKAIPYTEELKSKLRTKLAFDYAQR